MTIIGAGMAGLSCGHHLQRAGIPFRILEASDGVGGRVRTDKVDGFLLDRGFQIFLTSYPEAKAMLDYASLDLKPFYAGRHLLLTAALGFYPSNACHGSSLSKADLRSPGKEGLGRLSAALAWIWKRGVSQTHQNSMQVLLLLYRMTAAGSGSRYRMIAAAHLIELCPHSAFTCRQCMAGPSHSLQLAFARAGAGVRSGNCGNFQHLSWKLLHPEDIPPLVLAVPAHEATNGQGACMLYLRVDSPGCCAGADVWWNGSFHRVADPLRHPVGGVASLANPIGSVGDKINVGLFRLLTLLGPLSSIYTASESTTLDCLRVSPLCHNIAWCCSTLILAGHPHVL